MNHMVSMKVNGSSDLICNFMKKTLFSYIFLLSALSACQQINIAENKEITSIYGHIEQIGPSTKTYLDENRNVRWQKGDQVSAFINSTAARCFQISDAHAGETSGSFEEVEIPTGEMGNAGIEIDGTVVYYPYSSSAKCAADNKDAESFRITGIYLPTEQTYTEGTVAQNLLPMIAVSSTPQTFTFRNICGILNLQIVGDGVLKTLTVKGNNGEILAGEVEVVGYKEASPTLGSNTSLGEPPVLSLLDKDATSVTLVCEGNGVTLDETVPTSFLLVLPPTTFEKGFEVVMTDIDGKSATATTTKTNSIGRSRMLVMPVVEFESETIFDVSDEIPDEVNISTAGGTMEIPVTTNANIVVNIPESARDWIFVVDTKAVREEVITLSILENTSGAARSADVVISTDDESFSKVITISQEAKGDYIVFEDSIMKQLCVAAFDTNGDGELSYQEAAEVVDLSKMTLTKKTFKTFNEFEYFTSVTKIPDSYFKQVGIKSIKFPESLKTIDKYAFYNCTSLESVEFPDGLKTIGEYAFYGCKSIQKVTLPADMTTLGLSAFENCSGIVSACLSGKINTINSYVFRNCTSLVDVDFKNGALMGSSMFMGCSSIKTIEVPSGQKQWGYMFSGCSSLEEIEIPDDVEYLTHAFENCKSLKSISIPESVKDIDFAFENCTSLETVYMPGSLNEVGPDAFENCQALKSVYIPSIETWCKMTFDSNPLLYGADLYCNGEKMVDLVIPENITSIKKDAFMGCGSLKTVVIPDNVSSLGAWCFSRCNSLEEISISEAISEIPIGFAWDCENLRKVSIPESVISIKTQAFSHTGLLEVNLPESVMTIEKNAFSECDNLKIIHFPSDIISLGEGVCSNCDNLEEVYIPGSLSVIPKSGFSGCASLKKLTIEEGVKKIDYGCFSSCDLLEEVKIPNSVKDLGGYVFSDCENLRKVEIPALESWGGRDFSYCKNLSEVILAEGLIVIGNWSFENTKALKSIVIPSTVCGIGKYAFSYTGLKSIYMKPVVPPSEVLTDAFRNLAADCIFYVPTESVEAYKTDSYWSTYADRIVGYDFQ